jgi:hypothetical protein
MSNKLRLIGLAIAAVSAFGAVSAGAAQAAPHWTVETSNPFTGEEKLAETVALTPRVAGESPPTTELTIPSLGISYNSTGLSVQGGAINGTNKLSATSLSFTGVTVTNAAGCRVRNAGGTFGTIKTEPLKAELSTIGTATYLLLTPVGTNFVTIEVTKAEGKTCAISGSYATSGTFALQVQTETMNGSEELTSNEAAQKASGKEVRFASKPLYFDATIDLSLASGKKWGVALTP